MKETPIFSASDSFTTNVNRNYTLKENITINHFGDLVLETSDLSGIANKSDMSDWIADHLKITATPSIPNTVDVEVNDSTVACTYVSGSISSSVTGIIATIDATNDTLSITCDINFTYSLMVYHSPTQGVDVAVPAVTVPFSVFGVITE